MQLDDFFLSKARMAIGFSGGVDSAFLLYSACKMKADIIPYFVKTVFQPEFELSDAKKLCSQLSIDLKVIELDILSHSEVAANTAERCYFCKKNIFSAIAQQALNDGCTVLLDGTNASDSQDDRPGMRALRELSVRSPLRECGITKPELRALSHKAGLFTWNKPAYACLATRIATGEKIDADTLRKVEYAENGLFKMGYSDFRVRTAGGAARLQFKSDQLAKAQKDFPLIVEKIGNLFRDIVIDQIPR